ncbi:MAG: hypothetical protein H6974_14210 [Gammaproteobacteria bacterium]|nr:hypothetical protein [Gammaproteobacteria bacterium]
MSDKWDADTYFADANTPSKEDNSGFDQDQFLKRLEKSLGITIPEKAVLHLPDFKLVSQSRGPEQEVFEWVWKVDNDLRLRLERDLVGDRADLKLTMESEPYDAPLYWDETQAEAMEVLPSGMYFLSPEETQRIFQLFDLKLSDTRYDLFAVLQRLEQNPKTPMPESLGRLLAWIQAQGKAFKTWLAEQSAELSAQPALLYSRSLSDAPAITVPDPLVFIVARTPDEVELGIEWSDSLPASEPDIQVQFAGKPISPLIQWKDDKQSLVMKLDGIGEKELAVSWEWSSSDERLQLFLQTTD